MGEDKPFDVNEYLGDDGPADSEPEPEVQGKETGVEPEQEDEGYPEGNDTEPLGLEEGESLVADDGPDSGSDPESEPEAEEPGAEPEKRLRTLRSRRRTGL